MLRAHMKSCLTLFVVAAIASVGAAQNNEPDVPPYEPDGFIDIVFLGTSAGQVQDTEFEFNGAIDIVNVVIGFQSYDEDSWAADLAIALIDPSGNAVHFGGYDMFFNYENYGGQFPETWRQSSPGQPNSFDHEFNISAYNLQGDGIWTMRLMNGYSASEGSQWGGQLEIGDCPECVNDSNGNGVEDEEDIADGTSQDCDSNGIPDETQRDCDSDGIPDACEIDEDRDGTPDDCQFIIAEPVEFALSGPGGSSISIPFPNNKSLTHITVNVEFNTKDLWTWASDLLIVLRTPDGTTIQFGGYDVSMGSDFGAFPANMNSHLDGEYSHTFTFPQRLEGEAGEWTLMAINGFSNSTDAEWSGTIDIGYNSNYTIDCNLNGVDDATDIASGDATDCNGNGVPDSCDIQNMSGDSNGDGVIDECQLNCKMTVPFEFSGTAAQETVLEFPFSGSAFQIYCSATYENLRMDQTWAGDLLVLLTDPSGRSIQIGGYNGSFENYSSIGDFPGTWDTLANGYYSGAMVNIGSQGLSGDGDWTIRITNGFNESNGARWSGEFTICTFEPVLVIEPEEELEEEPEEPVIIVDCNENGIEDSEDIDGGFEDCNVNGILDSCEINDSPQNDINANDRLDSCDRAHGDLNLDGCIDGVDFGLMMAAVGVPDHPYADINGDGVVDSADLGILLTNFGEGCEG